MKIPHKNEFPFIKIIYGFQIFFPLLCTCLNTDSTTLDTRRAHVNHTHIIIIIMRRGYEDRHDMTSKSSSKNYNTQRYNNEEHKKFTFLKLI